MSCNIKNLSFAFNKKAKPTLKNVNLTIKNNSICVLLGLNGSGKTTLLKNVVGLLKPTKGQITIDNIDIHKISPMKRSKLMAYVPQKIDTLDDFNVFDYLTYSLCNNLKFYQTPNKKQVDKVIKIAKQFNLTHLFNKTLGELSGGERQIIGVCAAVIQNTKYILLDEPTSALDLKNQNNVLEILKKLTKKHKTIILTSHNPNHALYLDANVALIKNKTIIDFGSAKTLINVEKLRQIYGNKICYSKKLPYNEITFKN